MERSSGLGLGSIFLAFLTGAAAGAAVALLNAPEDGEAMRRRLRGLAMNSKDKVARLPAAIKNAGGVAKDAFSEAYKRSEAAAKDEFQKM
jgi:gas vesicle protein